MDNQKVEEKAQYLLEFLYSIINDRGIMADLRRGFNEDTQSRSWPHIANFCDLRDTRQRLITQIVTAGFAICSKTENCGNMGKTMRDIAINFHGSEGIKCYETRFLRIISADSIEELFLFLPGILRTAATKDIPVNFYKLYIDLWFWGDKVKIDWASSYWTDNTNKK